MRIRITMFAAPAILVAFASAQPPCCGAGSGVQGYNPSTEVTIRGTIDEVQQVARGTRRTGTHVMLATVDGKFDVHLGPSAFLSKNDFSFAKGDQIEVTGSRVSSNGADFVIAREVKKGGKTLTLRDKNGRPEWAGPPQRPT